MSKVGELFETIGERIKATAGSDTIYGETRVVDGRSIIPVGKLRYGFGAGGGEGERETEEGHEVEGSGGGGGGGVSVTPVGFLVVDSTGERFVPVQPSWRRLALATVLGFVFGYLVARRPGSS